jgi:hypothetical protein
LQANHQNGSGRRHVKVKVSRLTAQHGDQRIMHQLDDHLTGGDRAQHILPDQLDLHLGTKSLTTGRATSASSNATRTSRMAAVMSASDSTPRPRNFANTPFNLSDKASNI